MQQIWNRVKWLLNSEFLDLEALPTKIKLWKRKWTDKRRLLKHSFKVILKMFQIFLFMEIISYIARIDFYTRTHIFRHEKIKNLRNSSAQESLTDLALLSVYRQIKIDLNDVIIWPKKKKKKIRLCVIEIILSIVKKSHML